MSPSPGGPGGPPGPPALTLQDLACGYPNRTVLNRLNLTLAPGELLCLLGPNGCGKTTLFKTILGLLAPRAGTIRLGGEAVAGWPPRRLARLIGYVPQAHTPPFPFTVLEVVTMGRAAHLGPFAAPGRADRDKAQAALATLAMAHLAPRRYTELSGGERQLVLIARALTQETPLLVMDEPTASLDFGHQVALLEHIRALVDGTGVTVVLTTHDPNHALRYATRVATIARDGGFAVGTPAEVITADYLARTYGVRAELLTLPGSAPGRGLICVPLGRAGAPEGQP